MRFAHGWPVEHDSPLLSLASSSSSSSSSNEEKSKSIDGEVKTNKKIVSTSLDATSRTLAIVTRDGIELWDSGQNRTLLCEKRKPKSASEYVHAEWKPNCRRRHGDEEEDVSKKAPQEDEDDDESMSASHKERTLLVLTKSGNVLVFLVSVGKVEEFSSNGGSNYNSNAANTTNNNNNNAGSEQRCGVIRSASCVLKRAIKVKVLATNSSSSTTTTSDDSKGKEENAAPSFVTTFACAEDGQGVFFGTSRGGLAYAKVFPKGKLFATTQPSELVLKEVAVVEDVCAALAPRHHRRRKSRTSNSHNIGDALDDENYDEDFEFDDRYSDEDEEEYIRSKSPKETSTATIDNDVDVIGQQQQQQLLQQHDAVVSVRTSA